MKPVRRDRLEVAVNKVRARMVAANEQVAPLESGALSDRPVAEFTAVTIDAVPPIVESSDGQSAAPVAAKHPFDEDLISIESGGRIRVVDRRDVLFAESSGDYVRLHLASTSMLVRASMSTLEEHWATAGFVRIHRSYLVSLSHVSDVLVEHGHGYRVTVGDRSLPVSRRLAGQLRTHLVEYAARRARP